MRSTSCCARVEHWHVDDEGLEILVIVLTLGIVMRRTGREIGLCRGAKAQQNRRRHIAVLHFDDFHRAGQGLADLAHHVLALGNGHEVSLVHHHEVGAQQLVLEHFFERIVVIERRVLGALLGKLHGIVGEAAIEDRSAVDHRDHAVDRDA